VEKGLEIIRGLRGFTSGYAIPHLVIDAPGGGGKIPILPNYIDEKNEKGYVLRNYQGKSFLYKESLGIE
jgi:lysine 2,3-aminomutase